MGLLNNSDWNDAYRRTIAKTTAKTSIVEVRDVAGKPREDGKPPMDVTFITLRLEQDVKDQNGDTIAAGGTVDVSLNTAASTDGDEKVATMNRISQERFRELVVAALGLDPKTKDVASELTKAGGADALKGRTVVVDFSPSTKGQNNVNRFAALPKA